MKRHIALNTSTSHIFHMRTLPVAVLLFAAFCASKLYASQQPGTATTSDDLIDKIVKSGLSLGGNIVLLALAFLQRKTINKTNDQLKQKEEQVAQVSQVAQAAQTAQAAQLAQATQAVQAERAAHVERARVALTEPIQHAPGDRNLRTSTMLIGIGGVGKTTLIGRILRDDRANPSEATQAYHLYYGTYDKTRASGDNIKYHFHVSDYKGQNVGTLVQAFVSQQKMPYSPMAYDHVNALIVMVDLFAPLSQRAERQSRTMATVEEERVKEHMDSWNSIALDAVFGLVTNKLRYVCLFINKADLLLKDDAGWQPRIKEMFAPLKTLLDYKVKDIDGLVFDVIVGSASNGEGLYRLTEGLERAGVRGTTPIAEQANGLR